MEQIRSFIAIELPDEVKLALGQLEARLKSGRPSGVKWVDPESIHLTLKFLGNITVDSIGAITQAMAEAAGAVSPFHLEVKDLGVFPNLQRVQVAWVGISGEVDRLGRLTQFLEANLARLGFAPETRPFTPHLTLARAQRQASMEERQRLGQLIVGTSFPGATMKVEALNLMRSELTRAGAIYHRINRVELKLKEESNNESSQD